MLYGLIALCCLVSEGLTNSLVPGRDYVEGEVIVTFKASVTLEDARRSLTTHQLNLTKHFAFLSGRRQKHSGMVRAKDRTTADLIAQLKNDSSIEAVEPNGLRWPCGVTPNDPRFGQLWALHNAGQTINGLVGSAGADIKFGEGWSLARRSTNQIVVAVIDSGVEYTHPDLAANMWVNPGEIPNNSVDEDGNGHRDDQYGYDFADDDSDPRPASLHGTHVAGTIAAAGNNRLGVIGVDYQARILALKVAEDADPSFFSDSAIIQAIEYATEMKERGVNVVAINASFGGPDDDSVMRAAIQAAGDAGIIFCTAAGNDTANNDVTAFYPAGYRLPNLIVVAATDQQDRLASFSNYGSTSVDLAAPGVNILSTIPTNMPQITCLVREGLTEFAADGMTFSGTTTGLTAMIYDCGLGYETNFPAVVEGNIALISRGTIFFSEKVANAMAAGARAAIIYNNVSGSFLGTLQSPSNWIPAVSVSQADGLAIRAALPATGTVASFLDPANVYRFSEGTSMSTPHVSGAVAFAARNFPEENVAQRVQRILGSVDTAPALQGKLRTGGRLNLLRIADADSNGLPDWWEQAHFGHLTGTDPKADPDHDGASNFAEWLAETDPLNASSAFRILGAERTASDVRVTWTTVGGHTYQLQMATDFDGGWATNFVALSAAISAEGTGESTTNFVHVGGATNAAGFYRVRQD